MTTLKEIFAAIVAVAILLAKVLPGYEQRRQEKIDAVEQEKYFAETQLASWQAYRSEAVVNLHLPDIGVQDHIDKYKQQIADCTAKLKTLKGDRTSPV